MASAEKSNEQLAKYLDAYLADDDAPPFAVLIKGPWGVGKTHFVRALLEESPHLDDQHRSTYVSLNGLETPEEIDRALAVAIAPYLDTSLAKTAGRIATIAARYLNVDPQIKLSQIVSKMDSKLYVFDDLERFAGDKLVALGYINEFVERHGKKVIVISNTEEIKDEEFNRRKEKTIGQELEFQSHPRSVTTGFVEDHLDLPEGVDPTPHVKLIVDLFFAGKVENLRALRHAIWDHSRLVKSLEKKHTNNAKFMLALTTTFFPIAFDHRLKRLSDDDIANIGGLEFLGIGDGDAQSAWSAFQARYVEFDPNERIFPAWVWRKLLVDGVIDDKELREAASGSGFFSAGGRPSWRRIWSHQDETPEELEALYKDMRARIDRREYDNPDEVLHVFAILIWLGGYGLHGQTVDKALEEAKRYIDKLRADGRLSPYSEKLRVGQPIDSRGIGYKDGDGGAFSGLARYMREQREAVAIDALPSIAQDLLGLISTDLSKWVESICFTEDGRNQFIRTPLLHHIDPQEFLDAVMALSPVEQQRALAAVSYRYKNGELRVELAPEEPWLRRVSTILQEGAAKKSGFAALRLRNYGAWYFEKTIGDHERALAKEKKQNQSDEG